MWTVDHFELMPKHFGDPSVLGVFVDNHDNPRFLSENNNHKRFESAIVLGMFTGLHDFALMSSSCQFRGDPHGVLWDRTILWWETGSI
jgi:hypothetical protein